MTTAFKLRFPNGVSLYENRHILHSDMLWGAVCNAANLLLGKSAVDTLLQPDVVKLTSSFPFVGDEFFFPKPLSFYKEPEDYAERKRFKKVRFVSEKLWKEILSGKEIDLKQGKYQGILWYEKMPKSELFSTLIERPRVTVDRVTTAPTLFSSDEAFYDENAGFFFLAEFSSNDAKSIFTTALRLLADEGIGADRSVGKGWFVVDESSYQLPQVQSSSAFLLLSLYTPAENEISLIDAEKSFYEIVERSGWVTSFGGMTLRRRKVRAFSEGSVLYFRQGEPKGQIYETLSAQQTLTHNVYRNLQAFAISIKIEEKK